MVINPWPSARRRADEGDGNHRTASKSVSSFPSLKCFPAGRHLTPGRGQRRLRLLSVAREPVRVPEPELVALWRSRSSRRLKTARISAKESKQGRADHADVDAQIHIWKNNKPTNPNHRQVTDFTADDVLKRWTKAASTRP